MKFLILTQYFYPEIGAPQTRFGSFIHVLKKLGHEVEVVTALPNHPTGQIFKGYRGRFYKKETIWGVPVHRYWMYAAQGKGVKRLVSYLSFCLISLLGIFKVQKPDYIFVESPPLFLGITAWVYKLVLRRPIIFNVADLWPDSVVELNAMKKGFVYNRLLWLEKKIYQYSKYVNAVTDKTIEILVQVKGVKKEKVRFLPNGVDSNIFFPGEKDWDVLEKYSWHGKIIIVYAGTIGYAQGLEYMVHSMEVLGKKGEFKNVRFVLVGEGPEAQKLKDLTKDKKMSNVDFLGVKALDEVAGILRACDIGYVGLIDRPLFKTVRPSKVFPLVASGLPILYAGKGEMAQIVQEKKFGLVCSPENIPDHVAKLEVLIQNLKGYKEQVLGTQKEIYETYSWDVNVKKWLDSIEKR